MWSPKMNVYCEKMLNKTPLSATNTQVRPNTFHAQHSTAPTAPSVNVTSRHSYPKNSNAVQQPTSVNTDSKSSAQISHSARRSRESSSSSIILGHYLGTVLQKQNNLTDILVKQQLLSTLPRGDILVFSGDILQCRAFLNSFEHIIESMMKN